MRAVTHRRRLTWYCPPGAMSRPGLLIRPERNRLAKRVLCVHGDANDPYGNNSADIPEHADSVMAFMDATASGPRDQHESSTTTGVPPLRTYNNDMYFPVWAFQAASMQGVGIALHGGGDGGGGGHGGGGHSGGHGHGGHGHGYGA